VVFKVPGKAEGQKLKEEIWVAGYKFKAQPYVPNRADTLCGRCSEWGHSEFHCQKAALVCGICSGNHFTAGHRCEVATCGAIGRACPHAMMKCPGCGRNHPANDAWCLAKLNAIAIARGSRNGIHQLENRQTEVQVAAQTPRQPQQCTPAPGPPTVPADEIRPVSEATRRALVSVLAANWREDQDKLDAAMEVDTTGEEPSGTVPPVAV